MARCWTCGTEWEQTAGDLYICESCEDISNQIRSLHGDVRYASDRVSGKFDDLIYEQRQGFNALSSGIQDIAGGMYEIVSGIQDMAGGMYEIASVIEWGFGELSWQMQQQTSVLQEIADILKTPSETQAEEWRLMAEELRRRGVCDESIELFLKALNANRLDYRIYVGLAETYLRIGQFDNAKTYFEKSLPHAPSRANFTYKSYSLRFIGHIYYCRADYAKAIELVRKAVELSPGYTKAHYDLAQYYAVIRDARKAIPLLRKAIERDSIYFDFAEREQNFNPVRDAVLHLLEDTKREAHEKTQNAILAAEGTLKDAENSQAHVYALQEYGAAKAKLVLAMDKFDSGVYNSILAAKPIATEAYEIANEAKEVALEVRQKIKEIEKERNTGKVKIEDTLRKKINRIDISSIFSFIGMIIIIMSIIKWNFGFYLWACIFSGISTAFETESGKSDIIDIITSFILGFILAPLMTIVGVLLWVGARSDEYKKHTKQLKELNENYGQKLERFCDLGEGLKRGETLSAVDWLNRGRSYAEARSFDTAISCFDSALALDLDNDIVWVSKGNSLEKVGRNDEAIACCDRALKMNSENFKAWNNKGLCLNKLNRIEEALRCYDKALKINPNADFAWSNKGLSLMKLGRTDEALTCCDKALEINPIFIEAWINKGRTLEELGEFEEAISCYNKALKINPEHKMAREYKEACLQKL